MERKYIFLALVLARFSSFVRSLESKKRKKERKKSPTEMMKFCRISPEVMSAILAESLLFHSLHLNLSAPHYT